MNTPAPATTAAVIGHLTGGGYVALGVYALAAAVSIALPVWWIRKTRKGRHS